MIGKWIRTVICWLLLLPLIVIILFPFAAMLSTALKRKDEVFTFTPSWLPDGLYLGNFSELILEKGFGRAIANSLYISFGATLVSLVLALPAAYALSRLPMRGKGAYSAFLLVTQMISPIVLILGLFRMFAALGMINDHNALIVAHSAFFMAFAIWMLKSYFDTIPKEIEEAAWLDGASRFRAFRSVFLPLCVPGIAVTSIFTFVNSWNEYAMSLTMLREGSKQTAPVRISFLTGSLYEIEWNLIMAATLITTVPVAIIFSCIQGYLVRGLSVGGVK
jgi:multiple sugar transport system permease protein